MGFAALNPAASRALAIERGGEGFSIRRFDGAQLGEKAFLILTRRNAVGPLYRGLALTQFPGRELRTSCSRRQPGYSRVTAGACIATNASPMEVSNQRGNRRSSLWTRPL
jgi:hypothetical protein